MKHTKETKDRCYQLRAAGANFNDIARICNISEKAARTWCHDHPEEIEKWLNDDEREFIYFHLRPKEPILASRLGAVGEGFWRLARRDDGAYPLWIWD